VPVVPVALNSRAGVDPKDVQRWTAVLLAINGAALVAVSPIAGLVADYIGSRRTPLVASLLALMGASMMLCFGRSVGIYVVDRLLLGISGAVVWTVGLALVVDSVPKAEVGKYLGYVFMSINMAVLVVPLVGGVVYAAAGYYAVFYVSFGLIALDVVLRIGLIEKRDAKKWTNKADTDRTQTQLQTKSISPSTTEDMEKQGAKDIVPVEKGTTSSATATNLASTKNPVAETPQAEESRSFYAPIFSLLKSPRVLTAIFGCLVQSTLFSTFDTVLTLHVNALFGWGSLGSGLIFLGLLVPSLASPLVGWSNDKLGPK